MIRRIVVYGSTRRVRDSSTSGLAFVIRFIYRTISPYTTLYLILPPRVRFYS